MMRSLARFFAIAFACLLIHEGQIAPVNAQSAPGLRLDLSREVQVLFDPKLHACDGNDVPDANPRAFRDDKGEIVLSGMHFENRFLRGPDFDHLKLDCAVVFRGSGNADPSQYDDRSWISAIWTQNGRDIAAIAHHEFQGNTHPGRCAFDVYIMCWFNSVLALRSTDGGRSFNKSGKNPVLAAFPFPQDVGQGRHRGFFQPSNLFSDGKYIYFFAATTGWTGQNSGACLFRSDDINRPERWRAYDGKGFNTRFSDPYGKESDPAKTCQPIAPFGLPVGSVVRHKESGLWIGLFSASGNGKQFPLSGIYYATSKTMLEWSSPKLLLATASLYDAPCEKGIPKTNGQLISYPVLIDRNATGRNFDDTGNAPELYYSALRLEGCQHSSDRKLMRQKLKILIIP